MARLYHGSDVAVEHPDVSRNTGFSDLGRGFYLTDNYDAAIGRARSRARMLGVPVGIVSAYDFDEDALAWATWEEHVPAKNGPDISENAALKPGEPFGLKFVCNETGIAAWMDYIRSCRRGDCAVPELGEPAVVQAWIATDEVEMACSGFVPAEELAPFVDRNELIVQYCLRDQDLVDRALHFAEAEEVRTD